MRIGNRWTVAHRYEDRATRVVYTILPGETKEVPEHVGDRLLSAHPEKLYDADGERAIAGDDPVIGPAEEKSSRRAGVRAEAPQAASQELAKLFPYDGRSRGRSERPVTAAMREDSASIQTEIARGF